MLQRRLSNFLVLLIVQVALSAVFHHVQALDLRSTISPWLEDGTNTYLRVQRNVCIGIGPTATDALSICTAPIASATRALVNLSNTALSGGSASGTYLGANPSSCAGNFIDFQLADAARAKLTCDGTLTVVSSTNNLSIFAATTSAQLAGVISDETGSGLLVFATSPTLTTPNIGVATATTVNGLTLTTSTGTLTIANGKTLTASNTLTLTGTDGSSVAFGGGGTVAYTANNLSVFAATTSAQLAGVLSDETGTGVAVFGTSPTFTTQIGVTGVFAVNGNTSNGVFGSSNLATYATTGNGILVFAAASVPTSATAGAGKIWSQDIIGTIEMRVMDSAGNITTISPHNFSLFTPAHADKMPWSYYSERNGKAINVDMYGAIVALEHLTGQTFIYYGNASPSVSRRTG